MMMMMIDRGKSVPSHSLLISKLQDVMYMQYSKKFIKIVDLESSWDMYCIYNLMIVFVSYQFFKCR